MRQGDLRGEIAKTPRRRCNSGAPHQRRTETRSGGLVTVPRPATHALPRTSRPFPRSATLFFLSGGPGHVTRGRSEGRVKSPTRLAAGAPFYPKGHARQGGREHENKELQKT